jgi:hypothetical protein
LFGTQIANRTARGMAVGALILSLTATIGSGTANAAPPADETAEKTGCSVLAHERNEGRHRLHEAWKGFSNDLRSLQRDARQLDRAAKKTKSASAMTSEVREELDNAREELGQIRSDAHAKIQDLAELGQACKEEREVVEEDVHIALVSVTDNEDGAVTLLVQFNEKVECTDEDGEDCAKLFSYKASKDATASAEAADFDLAEDGMSAQVSFELDEDVDLDTATDELTLTAGAALKAKDGDEFETETDQPVDLTIETNDLVMKYREVVDEAILDMQAVIDEITAAMSEMTEAAETTETNDDAEVTADLKTAKAEREKAKEAKADAKGKSKDKSKAEASNSGKGNGKGKNRK